MNSYYVRSFRSNIRHLVFSMGIDEFLNRSTFGHHLKILLDKAFSNRKVTIVVLIVLGVLMFLGPHWFFNRESISGNLAEICLQRHIGRTYSSDSEFLKRFVSWDNSNNNDNEIYSFFVGNGLLGLALNDKNQGKNNLYVKQASTISISVPFDPVVDAFPESRYPLESSALVLDSNKGIAAKIAAYSSENNECSIVTSTFFAHRIRPNLLVQEISVDNPTLSSMSLVLNRRRRSVKEDFKEIAQQNNTLITRHARFQMPNLNSFLDVTISQHKMQNSVLIQPNNQESLKILTVVQISNSLEKESAYDQIKFSANAFKLYNDALQSSAKLYVEHVNAWNELWSHGFSISHSWAPDTLNTALINTTLYYLLSNTLSFIKSKGISQMEADQAKLHLYSRGECFSLHNTLLYPSKLWSHLSTADDVQDVTYRWTLTLDKWGCSSLVKAGAEGVLQAYILSLGGFKFKREHLEFHVSPQELHRDYYFQGIIYDPDASLDIWVEVGNDNKPILYVEVNLDATKWKSRKFYACDAGCLEPKLLSNQRISLPVKLTDPPTPILYITDNLKHVQELKHSIHITDVVEAPPHEHHVIALHKHGHRLGGLPIIFWILLIVLVVAFHLFLFKLIYNEYWRQESTGGVGGSNVSRAGGGGGSFGIGYGYSPFNRIRYRVS